MDAPIKAMMEDDHDDDEYSFGQRHLMIFGYSVVTAILCMVAFLAKNHPIQRRAESTIAATKAAKADKAEERRRLVRRSLEFRTIMAPPPKAKPQQAKTVTATGLVIPSGSDDGATPIDDDNYTTEDENSEDREGADETKSCNCNCHTDDENENFSRRNTQNETTPKNGGSEENGDKNNNDGENKTTTKPKKRSSGSSTLLTNILQNKGRTGSVRSLVADILGRGNNSNDKRLDVDDEEEVCDEENHPPLFALNHVYHVSMNRVPEACSICLEPFAVGDKVARMKQYNDGRPCSQHWFKEDCIAEWLQTHDDCPMSRIKIVYAASDDVGANDAEVAPTLAAVEESASSSSHEDI